MGWFKSLIMSVAKRVFSQGLSTAIYFLRHRFAGAYSSVKGLFMRHLALVPSLCLLVAAPFLSAAEENVSDESLSSEPTAESDVSSETLSEIPTQGDTLVITPMRRPTLVDRAPVRVDLITQDELRLRGNPSRIRDVIGSRSGVFIQGNGGLYGTATMRLRGTRNGDTRVLKDGLPVFDSSSIEGSMDLTRLNTAGMERAEILYGSQSGLYGSGAIGGVLSIQGARPTIGHEQTALAEVGMYNSQRLEGVFTGPIGDEFGYAITLSGSRSNGISNRYDNSNASTPLGDTGPHENDGHAQTLGNVRLEWTPHIDVMTYVSAEHQFSRFEYDSFSNPDDETRRTNAHDWRFTAGGEFDAADNLTFSGDLLLTINRRISPAESNPYNIGRVAYGQFKGTYEANEYITVDAGFDLEEQQYDTQPGSAKANQIGSWASLEVEDDFYVIGLTGRHDSHSREGSASTYRLSGALFSWEGRIKTYASYGTSFRAPTLYQLYDLQYGNRSLEAQRSKGYELGMSIKPYTGLELDVTWYRTDYLEEIAFRTLTLSPFTGEYYNKDSDSQVTGYEIRATFQPQDEPWTVVAYINPQRNENLAKVPELLAGIEATYEVPTYWVTLGIRHIGDQYNAAGTTISTEDYTLVYASVGYTPCDHIELYLRGENLGDKDYVENAGFATPGASVWGGVKATF